MKVVGLTGGIGSGKTTVTEIFSALGIPVFYADDEAKALYDHPEVIKRTQTILGSEDILNELGMVDRAKVAAIIFNDESKRMALNAYLHPLVKKRFEEWGAMQDAAYCIREAAILIESGSYVDCDKIIVVTSPIELRISRVMNRDHVTREAVEKRMEAQMPDDERQKYADFIIVNDKGVEDLKQDVLKIHQQLV